ncbi:MAG: DUF499 domain-containing protein [Rubrobacteraceae bacterium]
MYRENRSEYPSECVESEYERRLRSAYPIHPELFDRLYEDWSTLEKFQRTRGVLRLMAAVIHELWSEGDGSLLIMPGSIPLDEFRVRNQFVRYLPDGPESRPRELEKQVSNLDRRRAARRVARTVFVGSAPSVVGQHVRGLEEARVRLGRVQPSESSSVFGDALNRLADSAAYLYSDGTRHWYDTRPNVNRTAADRAQQQKREDVLDEITARLRKAAKGTGDFARVHVAPAGSGEVSDEPQARLVVLGPENVYRSGDPETPAREAARKFLDTRGASPRQYRNTLAFLAPDRDRTEALEGTTRRFLAWKSIVRDEEQLNLDGHGRRQARENLDKFDEAVDLQLEEAYQWLLYPGEEPDDGGKMKLEWSVIKTQAGGGIVDRASRAIHHNGALITSWAPRMLKNELDTYLWRGEESIRLIQVRDDLAKYLYLPRIKDEEVLRDTVREGASGGEFFAYAQSVTPSGRYEGLAFGGDFTVYVDQSSLIVHPDAARRQIEAEKPKTEYEPGGDDGDAISDGPDGEENNGRPSLPVSPTPALPSWFYGAVEIDPSRLGGKAGEVGAEVVQHFASIMGANAKVTIEIQAEVPEGIPEKTERDVSENCNTLKFRDYGFEA